MKMLTAKNKTRCTLAKLCPMINQLEKKNPDDQTQQNPYRKGTICTLKNYFFAWFPTIATLIALYQSGAT